MAPNWSARSIRTATATAPPTAYPLVADLDALLRIGLDYAVLACPTLLHEPLGTALAAAGIPTLIEKPLAGDPDSARRPAQAFHTAAVPAAVGYIERFNPALIALRRRLEDGQLGDVFSVATRRTGPYPVRITDVGVIHDLATHDLDLTAWITNTHYTSIAARTAHRSGRPHEDLLAALGQLTDGTITHHQVNWVSPLKERTTVVTGDHGILVADTSPPTSPTGPTAPPAPSGRPSPHSAESPRATSPATPFPNKNPSSPSTKPSATCSSATATATRPSTRACTPSSQPTPHCKPPAVAPLQPSPPPSTLVQLDRLVRHRRCGRCGVRQQSPHGWI
jgi:predicted dehydrogenase